jgi:hypothetical protein
MKKSTIIDDLTKRSGFWVGFESGFSGAFEGDFACGKTALLKFLSKNGVSKWRSYLRHFFID